MCILLTGTPYSSAVCLRKGAHKIKNIPKFLKTCFETRKLFCYPLQRINVKQLDLNLFAEV